MASISFDKERKKKRKIIINQRSFDFLKGVIIGICLMLFLFHFEGVVHVENNLRHYETKDFRVSNDGWNSISVYFGENSKLRGYSQVDQDKIILALTKEYRKRNKVSTSDFVPYFVDLAANDATALSNTLLLEKSGWSGLCIEPNPIYWYGLANRKCDVAAAFIGGKTDMQKVQVSLTNKEFGGIVAEGMDNSLEKMKRNEVDLPKETRYTISIKSLFQKFQVPKSIEYFSLDVEGAEELIMKDFPFSDYVIRFLTIERPKPTLQALLEMKGYRFVMQLIYWGETLWVHQDVLIHLSMTEIKEIVNNVSRFAGKSGKGQMRFDLESGKYGYSQDK